MKRKLLALNLVLAMLATGFGWRLRQKWQEAQAREQAIRERIVKPAALIPEPASPPGRPLTAAAYEEVATKMLFSRDRNPDVVLEAAPPKPMPPLPIAHGVLDIGSGPTAILAEKPGAPQRGYRVGEPVGEFVVAEVTATEIAFTWEGQVIRRNVDELVAKTPAGTEAAQAPAAASQAASAATTTVLSGTSSSSQSGPGVDVGGQVRACQPGDTSPPGTVSGGYRKVVADSPFGKQCRWEPVK